MGNGELLVIAIGLSMDAFAVSVCKGLATKTVRLRHMLKAGLWFGGFQGLMPLLGYLCGSAFQAYIEAYDHWIAFVLLSFLGIKTIREAWKHEAEPVSDSFAASELLPLAIATSIDALAVGVTFAILPDVQIFAAVGAIAAVTLIFCAIGVKLGNLFGSRYQKPVEVVGGIILILMGAKILLEHLGILPI